MASTIQIRVDDDLKKKSDNLFRELGTDTTTAIRMFLTQAVAYNGFPFEIKYETTDPAVHYYFARTYYEEQSTPAGDLKTTMPGAYTNTGILFVLFSNWIDEIDFYNIYIMFDLII